MEPGIYRLKKTIINPRGDKRCTDRYWRRPKWVEGDRFAIYPYDEAHHADVIEPLAGNHETRIVGGKMDNFTHLFLHELELLPETLFSILKVKHFTEGGVLNLLLDAGHIDLGNIKAVIRQNEERIAKRKEQGP